MSSSSLRQGCALFGKHGQTALSCIERWQRELEESMMIQLGQGRLRPVAAVALACASLIAATALGSIFLRTSLDAWTTITAPGPAGPADGILLTTGLCGTLLTL